MAGEPSGDLHASNLMAAIRQQDSGAQFMGLGGELMEQQGCRLVHHYRDMAYMGFIEVVAHLGTILSILKEACNAIEAFEPHAVVLVDYPSFNFRVAKYVKRRLPQIPVYYYIAPKVWAWKQWRVKTLREKVDRVFSILPFEVEWFRQRGCEVSYVGNPCVDAVEMRPHKDENFDAFASRNALLSHRPVIAILPGSRKRELEHNLPKMLEAASHFQGFQIVVAGAPSMPRQMYEQYMAGYEAAVVYGETYQLLQQARVAVVTSGTATLETALLKVPQVVVYQIDGGKPVYWLLSHLIKVKHVSLVNLIAGREVVKELVSYLFSAENIESELKKIIEPSGERAAMLAEYDSLIEKLGREPASQRAARELVARAAQAWGGNEKIETTKNK